MQWRMHLSNHDGSFEWDVAVIPMPVSSLQSQQLTIFLEARKVEAVEFAIKSLALMRRDAAWQTTSEL